MGQTYKVAKKKNGKAKGMATKKTKKKSKA